MRKYLEELRLFDDFLDPAALRNAPSELVFLQFYFLLHAVRARVSGLESMAVIRKPVPGPNLLENSVDFLRICTPLPCLHAG